MCGTRWDRYAQPASAAHELLISELEELEEREVNKGCQREPIPVPDEEDNIGGYGIGTGTALILLGLLVAFAFVCTRN